MSDSSLESANSRIRQVLPQTNLTINIRRAYPFIRNWKIEKVSSKWDKLWQKEIQAQFLISKENKQLAVKEH